MWYKIKVKMNPRFVFTHHLNATSIEVVKQFCAQNRWSNFSISEDLNYQSVYERKEYWRDKWQKALLNMPRVKFNDDRYRGIGGGKRGAQSALAWCLGYTSHQAIWSAWCKSSKPKDDRQRQLLILAGPYGKTFARLKMIELGIAKRYLWD